MGQFLDLAHQVFNGTMIDAATAYELIQTPSNQIMDLLYAAHWICQQTHGQHIDLCSIINAKSGQCSEDCSFCAQSSFYQTNINPYPLLSQQQIFNQAAKLYEAGAQHVGIVTSGKSIYLREFDLILDTIQKIKNNYPEKTIDASLGILKKNQAIALKYAGLDIYHHNLETAESFFPNVCTTHTYAERLNTIHYAQEAGLDTCVGVILGIGESIDQRIEVAYQIQKLNTGGLPINFLHPVLGTKTGRLTPITALDALKTIAVYRFIFPRKTLRIAGGRLTSLGELQTLMYFAGANAIITGDYLTTTGKLMVEDIQMIHNLGLDIEKNQP